MLSLGKGFFSEEFLMNCLSSEMTRWFSIDLTDSQD